MEVREEFLHWIWRMRRLPLPAMKLVDGRSFNLIQTGEYNQFGAGPDFFNGSIEVDGLIWHGSIEIHLKSSDWFLHKHHLDSNYNNVILHVVMFHDKEIRINNIPLPTLEIKDHIPYELVNSFRGLFERSKLPCAQELPKLDPIFLFKTMESAVVEKLESKSNYFTNMRMTKEEVLNFLLIRFFGYPRNEGTFESLNSILEKYHPNSIGMANISTTGSVYKSVEELLSLSKNKNESEMVMWIDGGNFPIRSKKIKTNQFIHLKLKLEFRKIINLITADEHEGYWRQLNKELKKDGLNFGTDALNRLLINVSAPFLFWTGSVSGDYSAQEEAFELLHRLPTEKNWIVREWEKRQVTPISAFWTQGMIHQFKTKCASKKCLTCTIGTKILSR